MTVLYHHFSMDYRQVHRPPQSHGGQYIRRALRAAHKFQPPGIHHKQICAFALSEAADVLPAQQPGAAPGSEFEHFVACRGLLAGDEPMQQVPHPQLFQ